MELEARINEAEAALGRVALAVDGSSWPNRGSEILRRIEQLQGHIDGGTEAQALLPEMQSLLLECARGIMEAHMNMKAAFWAAGPYIPQVSDQDRAMIQTVKRATADPEDAGNLDALRRSFAAAERFHHVTAEAYAAALRGDAGHGTKALEPQLLDALGAG